MASSTNSDIKVTAYDTGILDVGDGHVIAWYRYGNPKGKPVVFLHGGPGSGFDVGYTDLFDLDDVDLITLDQRASGASTPSGTMEANTTAHLVADLEKLRMALGIQTWTVTGHSWGSTLGLVYAETHPKAVNAVCVCALFLGRRQDYEWTFSGARLFFADTLDQLKKELAVTQDGKAVVDRIVDIFANGTDEEKIDGAFSISKYGAPFSRLVPKQYTREDVTLDLVKKLNIMFSYYQKEFFLRENQICDDAHTLSHIPVTIVHGRLDMDCPVAQVFAFKEACPHSNLVIVHGSHSLSEQPMQATYKQEIAKILNQ